MIEKFEDTPFEKNHQSTIADDFYYRVYEDKWPVCDGHLLFVPKENSTKYITITLQATVQYGERLVEEGKIDGYHFGMNISIFIDRASFATEDSANENSAQETWFLRQI